MFNNFFRAVFLSVLPILSLILSGCGGIQGVTVNSYTGSPVTLHGNPPDSSGGSTNPEGDPSGQNTTDPAGTYAHEPSIFSSQVGESHTPTKGGTNFEAYCRVGISLPLDNLEHDYLCPPKDDQTLVPPQVILVNTDTAEEYGYDALCTHDGWDFKIDKQFIFKSENGVETPLNFELKILILKGGKWQEAETFGFTVWCEMCDNHFDDDNDGAADCSDEGCSENITCNHCGNGTCESYSPYLEDSRNCPIDCPCGDLVIGDSEMCDGPNSCFPFGKCSDDCLACDLSICGNGLCEREYNEDANDCPTDCPEICGDGWVDGSESCDGPGTCKEGAVCSEDCQSCLPILPPPPPSE